MHNLIPALLLIVTAFVLPFIWVYIGLPYRRGSMWDWWWW